MARGEIRTFVVDGHGPFRAGLRRLLEDAGDIVVVGESGDDRELEAAAGGGGCDLLVLNVSACGEAARNWMERLRASGGGPRLLLIADGGEERYRAFAVRAGAAGFLPKFDVPDGIVGVIRSLFGGE